MSRHISMKFAAVAALATVFTTTGVERASADLHGAVGTAIILCATGALNCNNQKRRTTTTRSRSSSGISAAQRQQNRDVQSALNAFNFPVGAVDGALGRKSRAAIGNYQAYMGWGSTGYLDDYQRSTLVDSWRKLQYGGGAAYPNMMAREGARGLLRTAINPNYPAQYGDNVGGNSQFAGNGQGNFGTQQQFGNQQQLGTQQFGNNNGGVVPQVPQTQGNQQVAGLGNTQQGQAIDEGAGGVKPIAPLPQLNIVGKEPVSATARCELVELTTQAKGTITAANMTDPNQALSEKFCDARAFSIGLSQLELSRVSVSENEMTGICGQIKDAMAPALASLGTQPPAGVLGLVASTNAELGLTDAESADLYGKICLGIGYRQDNAEMALSGALILSATGQEPFGELVGHHLREGFGVKSDMEASKPWFSNAISALERGADPVFEPSTTADRVMVIRKAIEMGGLRAGLAPVPELVPTATTLPVLQRN